MTITLVPAFNACTGANAEHGAPLRGALVRPSERGLQSPDTERARPPRAIQHRGRRNRIGDAQGGLSGTGHDYGERRDATMPLGRRSG